MNRDPPWTGARLEAGEVVSPAYTRASRRLAAAERGCE